MRFLDTVKVWNENRKVRKAARREARWAPFNEKREAAIESVGNVVSTASQSYDFYTAAVFVMTVLGFFYMPFIEVVAFVGSWAMAKHWSMVAKTEGKSRKTMLLRLLSYLCIPVSFGACVVYVLGFFFGPILPLNIF